jgi:hypothetical protein
VSSFIHQNIGPLVKRLGASGVGEATCYTDLTLITMNSVFISHNHADKVFVRRLARDLTKAGIKCWIDEAEIKVGDSLLLKIEKGIKKAKYLAVVLTPNSVKSEWVKKELEVALNSEITGRKLKVLPLLVVKCKVPGFLQGKAYADFTETYSKGLATLINTLVPKRAFDVGKQVLNGPPGTVAIFKDEGDRPVLLKRLPLSISIAEIRAMTPRKLGLWVRILFDDLKRLEYVELFGYKKTTRLSFSLSIKELVPRSPSSDEWRRTAEQLEIEIWNNDTLLMNALNGQELAVNWGGPGGIEISAANEISYYVDNEISWFTVTRHLKSRHAIDVETLEDLHFTSLTLSHILQSIIDSLTKRTSD